MIYLQMKNRVIISPEERLKIHHIADLSGSDAETLRKMMQLDVQCTSSPGIWKVPVIHAVNTISAIDENVTPLGSDACFVHIIPKEKQNRTHILRSVLAFCLLLFGSMLAISWFHADVNMAQAQNTLYRMITGHMPENRWMIAVPYSVGVFLGVALFYTLLGRKDTVSPLEIKLSEYHETSEKAVGKTP